MKVTKHNTLLIPQFEENLPLIKELISVINNKYSNLFVAVIVHGSFATNEIIPYSDFDGLLIVRDKWMGSKKLERFKKETMKQILKFDPLQHHGWFQIKESDLLDYPEHYLPLVILQHSKTIYPFDSDITLTIKMPRNIDYKSSLINMLNQFEKRDKENWKPKNMYQLKSILSQIMLIPCLYYSAINNKGILKRESFDAVRPLFSSKEWMPIKVASKIRNDWDFKLNFYQKMSYTSSNDLIRKISKKFLGPKIKLKYSELLNDEFYKNLSALTAKIKNSI